MKLIFIFSAFFILNIDASTLKHRYFVKNNNIYLSTIIENIKQDKLIYKIDANKHIKKVKTKELLKLLKSYGFDDFKTKSRYVSFVKKSPIDTSKIKNFIHNYYKKHYKKIDIQKIEVEPRGYIENLPQEYTTQIKSRNYLSKSGILDIKTPENKKIFFNYNIKATLLVYVAKTKIKKNTELSPLNTAKNSIILDKFKAKPIQEIAKGTLEAKHHIKKGSIITTRDIKGLSLVKKNSLINVYLHSKNMYINFSAKALDSGMLGDIIRVQKSDKKRLKVRVVGKNKAEIR
jgi:flagella basal body P-ring formation protein FlgA